MTQNILGLPNSFPAAVIFLSKFVSDLHYEMWKFNICKHGLTHKFELMVYGLNLFSVPQCCKPCRGSVLWKNMQNTLIC